MNTRNIGNSAEDSVYKYIVGKGYTVLHRNFTVSYGEADIIARDGNTYVFIEVKARRTTRYGRPAEAVTQQKMRKYLKLAQYYFIKNHIDDYCVRFDVAEVYIENGRHEINYIENAFDFTGISDFY